MELELRYYGDPILRATASPVTSFDSTLESEAEVMIETMQRERGIGLAGPQVGLGKRLIIVLQMANPDDVDADPLVLVNPEVVERGKSTWELEEGCLSIPGVSGVVTRPETAVIRYQDLAGKSHTITTEGMFARVALHEIDHLNGRLFIDYLSSAQKSLIKPRLKSIAAEHSA
jgi:peptide deformylase